MLTESPEDKSRYGLDRRGLMAATLALPWCSFAQVNRLAIDQLKAYSPEDFGARGDGSDETALVQQAADMAAKNRANLFLPPNKVFGISSYIRIRNGVQRVSGGGTLKPLRGASARAGLLLAGRESGESENVRYCVVSDITIDMQDAEAGSIGIYAQNSSHCQIVRNSILNLRSCQGVLVRSFMKGLEPASGNVIGWNSLFGHQGSIDARTQRIEPPQSHGISIDGAIDTGVHAAADGYWLEKHEVARVKLNPIRNLVTGNKIEGGYYGISLSGVHDSQVLKNTIRGNMRNISIQNECLNCLIEQNECQEAISSAIHLAYGSSKNQILRNSITSRRAKGEGLLQAYVSCKDNTFQGNTVSALGAAEPRYFIYTAVHSVGNKFLENHLTGRVGRAFIAVESDWDGSSAHKMHRATGLGRAYSGWATRQSSNIVIKNNTLKRLNSAPAIFLSSVSQRPGAFLSDVAVEQNEISGASKSVCMEIHEQHENQINNLTWMNNRCEGDVSDWFVLPRGRAHFSVIDVEISKKK
jgi:parallel beta-helix repeat protein